MDRARYRIPTCGRSGRFGTATAPITFVMNVTVASAQKIGVITADPIGPGFGLALYNQSKGTTNLVVDHYGCFSRPIRGHTYGAPGPGPADNLRRAGVRGTYA